MFLKRCAHLEGMSGETINATFDYVKGKPTFLQKYSDRKAIYTDGKGSFSRLKE